MTPIAWQRIEGALIAIASLTLAYTLSPGWPWWLWGLVLLAPDLSMLGYLSGPRIGAAIYNVVHLYAGGFILCMTAYLFGPFALILGALWLAHVGIDRAIGFGLKSESGFKDTHLGSLDRKN